MIDSMNIYHFFIKEKILTDTFIHPTKVIINIASLHTNAINIIIVYIEL